MTRTLTGVALAALLAPVAHAQIFNVDRTTCDFDRWMYPFNPDPGVREDGSTFGAVIEPVMGEPNLFDERDAQFLVGWNLGIGGVPAVPPGLRPYRYRVTACTVTATLKEGGFEYDNTVDPVETFYFASDPEFVPDADAGRPITLFGLAYRNMLNSFAFTEDFTYAFADPTLPSVRNAYASDQFITGSRDVSNNVEQRFEPQSFATGQIAGLTPGLPVPLDSDISFSVDLSNAEAVTYIQRSLSQGILRFAITSLHETTFMGQGSPPLPNFYTRDEPLAEFFPLEPQLQMTVEIVAPGDLNTDGVVNAADLAILLGSWGACANCDADLNGDGFVNAADLADLLGQWST